MEERHDQRGRAIARQAEYIMMFAICHAKRRIECAHILECALSGRNARNALFQPADVAAHLRAAPLLAGMADNLAHVGFRRVRQHIGAGQARSPLSSSSSTICAMLLADTFPAKPSLIRSPSSAFNSRHA